MVLAIRRGMTATLALASALLFAQVEQTKPIDPNDPAHQTARVIGEVAGGLLLGGLGEVGGVLGVCQLTGDFQHSGCLYSYLVGLPLGIFLGNAAGVVMLGKALGGEGSVATGLIAAASGALLSLLIATQNPYVAVIGGPILTTVITVLSFEGSREPPPSHSAWAPPTPLGLSVSIRPDPRSPALMLRGAF
jgi:hypothetical protein